MGKRRKAGSTGEWADPRPIIDLVIEQADPRLYTELYMQVGGEGGREGGRDRGAEGEHMKRGRMLTFFFITQLHALQAFAQIYNEGLINYDKVRLSLPPSLPPSLPQCLTPSLPPSVRS